MPIQNSSMMNDNQLKEAWKKLASDKDKIDIQLPNLRIQMEQEIRKFEQRIYNRDRREIVTAIGLLLVFVALAIVLDGYQRVGSLLLCAYLIWIIYYLTKAKTQKPAFSISKSIKEQLVAYQSYVLLQQQLVKNVLYWYILPLIPGMLLLHWGMESRITCVISLSINLFIWVYIYRMNQRAAKENYENLLRKLKQAIQNLET